MNTAAVVPPDYQPPDDLLAGRIILLTAAGDELGRSVALGCAQYGATVILTGKLVHQLEAVYDEIEAAGWPRPAIFTLDTATADTEDYVTMVTAIANEFGHLDGLVHTAGQLGALTPVESYAHELFESVIRSNLLGPFRLTQACLALLHAGDNASVIFTASPVARQARAYWGAYAVAGFGIEGLMQVLDQEHEQAGRLRINTLDPGPIRTRLRSSAYPGENPGDVPPPASVVPDYLYLLGSDSAEISGEALSHAKMRTASQTVAK